MDLTFVPVPSPHIADYVVIAIFLCICLGIGVYYGYQTDKNPTLENYFLGNRRLLLLPVAMSLYVTYMSAISLMGTPAEIYVYGIRGMYHAIPYFLSLIIANSTVVPLLYPLRLMSTYEYLQLRFHSKGVRTLGTILGMLGNVTYMGIALYAPGLALQIVAGIPLWLSIVVIGLVGTIYTAIGGIKSVVWTDVFQFVMIFIGLAAVFIKGSILVGTHYSMFEIATDGGRLEFLNFDPDPRTRHTMWGFCIGLPFTFIPNWCDQAGVQRVSSLRSLKAAKRVFWLLGPIATVFNVIMGYFGILLYSYYNTMKCDPVQAGFITNFNQLMPYFVLDVMRSLPGLSGIFISCLFSGALSTISSGINALSANSVVDILGDCLNKSNIIPQSVAAKVFVFAYGLVVIGLAYAINSMSGSVVQMSLSASGACGGPLAGLFFLGGMVPKANWVGAVIGSVSALVFNIWVSVGSQMYGAKTVKLIQNTTSGCYPNNSMITMNESASLMYNYNTAIYTTPYDVTGHSSMSPNNPVSPEEGFFLYNVSYTWYGFIGFFLTLIIGTVVSLCTGGDRGQPVEARLIFPICRKICGVKSKHNYDAADTEDQDIHTTTPGPPICLQTKDDDGASPL